MQNKTHFTANKAFKLQPGISFGKSCLCSKIYKALLLENGAVSTPPVSSDVGAQPGSAMVCGPLIAARLVKHLL